MSVGGRRRKQARFTVVGENFDGARQATVFIEQDGPHALFRVRPYHRRKEAVMRLSDVAELVIWRIAKHDAHEKEERRRATRRRTR